MTRAVEPIQAHAAENLRFIRDAMARASEFTAVPGWGGVAMGGTALVAAAVSGPPDNSRRWMLIWLADAAVAAAIGLAAVARKAQRSGTPLSTAAPARRFALAYVPPLVAGMILTAVFAALDLLAYIAVAERGAIVSLRREIRPGSGWASPGSVSGTDVGLLAAFGITQIGLGFVFLTIGARLLPAGDVALITLLEIVLGPLWVWGVLSERPSAASLLGGAIVLGAVVLAGRADPAPAQPAA